MCLFFCGVSFSGLFFFCCKGGFGFKGFGSFFEVLGVYGLLLVLCGYSVGVTIERFKREKMP
jgi:hypothetical protein